MIATEDDKEKFYINSTSGHCLINILLDEVFALCNL